MFPEADGDGLRPGPKRNFQVLDPLDFLAEFTQHIPPKGSHLIRYYGWYSNKARGMRRKAEQAAATNSPLLAGGAGGEGRPVQPNLGHADQAGVRNRPALLPEVPGPVKVVAFLEPPQADVIEKILRHCGLLIPSTPRAPPLEDGWVCDPDADSDSQPISSEQSGELTFVDMDEFLATF